MAQSKKTWLEILNGEKKPTSSELKKQIVIVEEQKIEIQDKISQLESDLDAENIQVLAGNSDTKKVDAISAELSSVKSMGTTLAGVLEKLTHLLSLTTEAEIEKQIVLLDKKVDGLRSEKDNYKPEFIKELGRIAGLWYVFFDKKPLESFGVHHVSGCVNLPFHQRSEDDKNIFREAFQEARADRTNIDGEISTLFEQKRMLLNSLSPEAREAYRLKKI
nr:hypothetical protein [uncultured Desulfobacter sp.]